MQARLESLVPPSCCATPAPMIGACCALYNAAPDGAPAAVADLADLTERGVIYLWQKIRSALKRAACCGGVPKSDSSACCRKDEDAKAASKDGCGCGGGTEGGGIPRAAIGWRWE